MHTRHGRLALGFAAVGALALTTAVPADAGNSPAVASTYHQTNLVSDVPGRAQITDPNLVNAWGMSFSPTSPLWVSDNGTGVSTLYSGGIHGGPQDIVPLVVTIPGGAPTGQVSNPTTDFVIHGHDGSSDVARFLFVGETGHLTGWSPNVPAGTPPSTKAVNAVVTPGAVYKGLAIGMAHRGPLLYAADFSARTVDVYDGSFHRVITPGNFEDPTLPPRFAPFNVAVLGGKVYVAYAKQDRQKVDEVAGAGLGRVDVFTLNGELLARMPDHSALNAPWGLTIAPAGFGAFSGDLLVGNFGNGRIHAYHTADLSSAGTVRRAGNRPVHIDGLWALMPGNGVEAGTDEVLFTAGPDDEAHGLLGTLSVNQAAAAR
jgi:uncharacterized protein (TIGR03118 family)